MHDANYKSIAYILKQWQKKIKYLKSVSVPRYSENYLGQAEINIFSHVGVGSWISIVITNWYSANTDTTTWSHLPISEGNKDKSINQYNYHLFMCI